MEDEFIIIYSSCGKYIDGYRYRFIENNVIYNLEILYDYSKILYISLSSGKKRKELKIYRDKENISKNGISVLVKIKDIIEVKFPKYYFNRYNECQYILRIYWADSRRKRVYSRLGWKLMRDENGIMCYYKKFKNEI